MFFKKMNKIALALLLMTGATAANADNLTTFTVDIDKPRISGMWGVDDNGLTNTDFGSLSTGVFIRPYYAVKIDVTQTGQYALGVTKAPIDIIGVLYDASFFNPVAAPKNGFVGFNDDSFSTFRATDSVDGEDAISPLRFSESGEPIIFIGCPGDQGIGRCPIIGGFRSVEDQYVPEPLNLEGGKKYILMVSTYQGFNPNFDSGRLERLIDNFNEYNHDLFCYGFGGECNINYFVYVSPLHTLNSLRPNAFALRNAFNLQSAKIAQGLNYDCTIYDQNNICVSLAGTSSDGKDFDGTTGALIVAHQPSKQFRWGAYVDQSMGSSGSGGLTIKNGKSGYGAFAVWSENTNGSGVRVRAAANVGNVDMESTREAFETAEAGFGRSNIESSGVQLEISKGYAINSTWGVRPYLGYRKTTNTRAAYAEQETDDVTAPLSYSSLKQNVETLSAGVTFAHTESAKTSMFLTAGVDHEAKNRFDRYQATSEVIEGIDSIDLNEDKRKTYLAFSLAVNHDFDKTQRLGVTLNHRKQVSASGSVTSAMIQYSKGF